MARIREEAPSAPWAAALGRCSCDCAGPSSPADSSAGAGTLSRSRLSCEMTEPGGNDHVRPRRDDQVSHHGHPAHDPASGCCRPERAPHHVVAGGRSDGQLVGVVGEADIVRESLVRDQRTLIVRLPTEDGVSVEEVEQVMTRQPITVPSGRRACRRGAGDGRLPQKESSGDRRRTGGRHDQSRRRRTSARPARSADRGRDPPSGAGRLVRLDDRGGQRRRDLRGSRLRERSARCAAPGWRRRGCSRYPVPSLMREWCVGSSRCGRLRLSADPVTPAPASESRTPRL